MVVGAGWEDVDDEALSHVISRDIDPLLPTPPLVVYNLTICDLSPVISILPACAQDCPKQSSVFSVSAEAEQQLERAATSKKEMDDASLRVEPRFSASS